nr:MAG TPA: hypothetical protein [Caudoviricetes sp.]
MTFSEIARVRKIPHKTKSHPFRSGVIEKLF